MGVELAKALSLVLVATSALAAVSLPDSARKPGTPEGLVVLGSPNQTYVLKLTGPTWRAGKPMGFGLRARLNEGPEMRLLFDTGARGLVISRNAARKLDLEELQPSWLEGFGSERRTSLTAVAQRLQLGGLVLRNVPVQVCSEIPAPDIDGVIGVDLFHDFLIRINGPKRTLELMPYTETVWDSTGFYPFQQVGHLILVTVRVNRRHDGQFLLDSGASYSVVDPQWSAQTAAHAYVQGVGGLARSFGRTLPVELELAGRSTWESDVIAMDLGEIRERHGVLIRGLIGYPAMARSVFTLDLREKRLRITER